MPNIRQRHTLSTERLSGGDDDMKYANRIFMIQTDHLAGTAASVARGAGLADNCTRYARGHATSPQGESTGLAR